MPSIDVYDASVAQGKQLDAIEALARELTLLELSVARARNALHDAMLQAYDDRLRPGAIAQAAGLSRQRLHQVLLTARKRRDTKESR